MNEFYTTKPTGLIGNEDVGQMSAWYIMSAMGFYQVTLASPHYSIGRPLFDEVTIVVKKVLLRITRRQQQPSQQIGRSDLRAQRDQGRRGVALCHDRRQERGNDQILTVRINEKCRVAMRHFYWLTQSH